MPGSIGGKNSIIILPGIFVNLRRGQKIPEFTATGTTVTFNYE